MSHDSSKSEGYAGWFKWLVGIIIALLAAGGGIVALFTYFNPPPPSSISITEPTQTVLCPPTGNCIFLVRGTSKNVATNSQTIVVFVDPGGGNFHPQNLDFSLTMQSSGDWEGRAQIGIGRQPSGTEFRIIALLMNRNQVPTKKQPYTKLPPSITISEPISLVVK